MKIYGVLRSRVTRPIWLLEEMGQPYEHVPVIQVYRLSDPKAADAPLNTASPEFLAINPQAQIPAMQDGDLVLTESMAITLYLARKFGGPLAPATVAEEGEAMQWGFAAITGIESHAIDILYTYAAKAQDSDEGRAKIEAAAAALVRPLARLNGHLAGREWLMGGRFTVADILVAECVRYIQPHVPLMAQHPAIEAWIKRCQARPAFQAMMERRNAEPL